jgi:hypothetical protein
MRIFLPSRRSYRLVPGWYLQSVGSGRREAAEKTDRESAGLSVGK